MKIKFKRIGIAVALAVSVIITGIFFYNNAEAVIVYEYNNQTNNFKPTSKNTKNNFENIQYYPEYTLKLKNDELYVLAENDVIYTMKNVNRTKLSQTDITSLERDGIKIASRSEVIELLYYFNS